MRQQQRHRPKQQTHPPFLKERISSDYGHLNNVDCSKLAQYLVKNNTQNVCLYHLSEENNLPDLAYQTTLERISQTDIAYLGDYSLGVAAKEGITEVAK